QHPQNQLYPGGRPETVVQEMAPQKRQTSDVQRQTKIQLFACNASFSATAERLVRHSTAPVMELRRNSRSDLPASSRAAISPTGRRLSSRISTLVPAVT